MPPGDDTNIGALHAVGNEAAGTVGHNIGANRANVTRLSRLSSCTVSLWRIEVTIHGRAFSLQIRVIGFWHP
jgi:hypothetical protein